MLSLPKLLLGVLLVVLSIITLVQAVGNIQPLPVVMDFPCSGEEDVGQESMNASTRMAYCISVWPFNMRGGGIFAQGTSDQDEAQIGGLRFRREGETLYVNNHPLDSGVHYEIIRWTVTRNPWLILTNRFEIRNDGLIAAFSGTGPDVLFISGDVFQGWMPNPLGLVILAAGMILVLRQLRG
jgi:hypothetical protein